MEEQEKQLTNSKNNGGSTADSSREVQKISQVAQPDSLQNHSEKNAEKGQDSIDSNNQELTSNAEENTQDDFTDMATTGEKPKAYQAPVKDYVPMTDAQIKKVRTILWVVLGVAAAVVFALKYFKVF